MEVTESIIENKLVYKVGIKDTTNENMLHILNELIPKLLENFNSDKKILFHCYQGISRSGCINTRSEPKYYFLVDWKRKKSRYRHIFSCKKFKW